MQRRSSMALSAGPAGCAGAQLAVNLPCSCRPAGAHSLVPVMRKTASRLDKPPEPTRVVELTALGEGGEGGAMGAGGLGGRESAVKPMPSHMTELMDTHCGASGWLVLDENEKSRAARSARSR